MVFVFSIWLFRLNTDIRFGRMAGFDTLLVTETGVNSEEDLKDATPEERPMFHLPSLPHLLNRPSARPSSLRSPACRLSR